MEGTRPSVRVVLPLQICTELAWTIAKATAAATMVAPAISHFDFQITDATKFTTPPQFGTLSPHSASGAP